MYRIYVKRLPSNGYATFGLFAVYQYGTLTEPTVMHVAGVTLELPERMNQKGISCVPAGLYRAFLRRSPKRGYLVIELRDVPNRENIQMHIGNTPHDTDGCILVGEQFGVLQDLPAIVGSRTAFARVMQSLNLLTLDSLEVLIEDA